MQRPNRLGNNNLNPKLESWNGIDVDVMFRAGLLTGGHPLFGVFDFYPENVLSL